MTALSLLMLGGALDAQAQTTTQTTTATAPTTPPANTDTTQAQPAAKADGSTTTVTVTAAKPQNRIDRQVYDNTKNIDSATGTASDALNKVPSVNVDNQGNVTLRGNSNVQVYIDGKPSPMMNNDNRASALQAMSSGDIDSVEVMNNPGAQYSSEGTGGIINLVMKKNRRPGGFGVVNLATGSDGRYNGGFTGSYNTGKLTFQGGLNFRHDSRIIHTGSDVTSLATGTDTQSHGVTDGKGNAFSTNGSVDYTISDKDSVGAQLNYSNRKQGGNTLSDYAVYNSAGAATSLYVRDQNTQAPHEDEGIDLHWDHTGQLAGETLKVDARLSRSDGKSLTTGTDTFSLPVMAPTVDTRQTTNNLKNGVFSVDYNRPVGQDLLSAGMQVTYDNNEFINTSSGSGTLNSTLTNDFAYQQTVTALYVTYQKPLGDKWTVLGGARLETLDLKTDLISSNTTGHINYSKLSPSFFATYNLSDSSKLRLQYSHRLQRPAPQDLNPYVTYQDPQNVTAGNPGLTPQETDSVELRYEVTKPILSYQLAYYYRKNNNLISAYSFFLTPGVLETTKQNAGGSSSGGLELNVTGKLSPKLTLQGNANLAFIDATDLPGVTAHEKATSLSGRIMASYTVTPKDTAQFMFFSSGKQLVLGQGYRTAFAMGNLSYKHNFTPKLSLNMTVNDPLRSGKTEVFTNTTTVRSESAFSLQAPTLYIGLSYTLGGFGSQPQNQQRGQWGGYRGPGGPGGPGGGPGGPGGPM